jgi:hypothetical protein
MLKPAPSGARYVRFGEAPHRGNQDLGAFPGTPCLTNPSYAGSFFCRQYFPHRHFAFQPLYGIGYGYVPAEYQSEQETPPPAPAEDTALALQVARLSDQVELLRQEQASRVAPPAPPTAPQSEAEQQPLPAILIYRDGHQGEVLNYAILGQTLWVFKDRSTRRIPLADLNLAATEKLNEQRGVDFLPLH